MRERVPHTHITQTDDIVADCPACSLIRPEVMTKRAAHILRGSNAFIFGPPLSPEGSA
jgi:hypothetical protein